MAWFRRKADESGGKASKVQIAEGLWIKCDSCKEIMYRAEVERAGRVCPKCHYPFRISARERIGQVADPGSFEERETGLTTTDPLGFKDTKKYRERVRAAVQKTSTDEAVICGIASVGARMQEGILSLMQMAKTSAALERLGAAGLPYISLLTDPTTGGVTASFAMLGDVIVAEPRALIGFAGPRVIAETIRQPLPEGFQRSEFLLAHGQLDMIVERRDLKETLRRILAFFADPPPRSG